MVLKPTLHKLEYIDLFSFSFSFLSMGLQMTQILRNILWTAAKPKSEIELRESLCDSIVINDLIANCSLINDYDGQNLNHAKLFFLRIKMTTCRQIY